MILRPARKDLPRALATATMTHNVVYIGKLDLDVALLSSSAARSWRFAHFAPAHDLTAWCFADIIKFQLRRHPKVSASRPDSASRASSGKTADLSDHPRAARTFA